MLEHRVLHRSPKHTTASPCVHMLRILRVFVLFRTNRSCLRVILSVGHSARVVYERLLDVGVSLEAKGIAVGFRIEHPQVKLSRVSCGECGNARAGSKRTKHPAILSKGPEYTRVRLTDLSDAPPPVKRIAGD